MRGIFTRIILLGITIIVVVLFGILALLNSAYIGLEDAEQPVPGSASGIEGTGISTTEIHPFSINTSTVSDLPTAQITTGLNAIGSAGHPAIAAELTDFGTDKNIYNKGEQATGFVNINNTGNNTINDVSIILTASRVLPFIGKVSENKEYTFANQNVQPGETKRLEFSTQIPSEYKGISTSGDYTFNVNVRTGNDNIGSFSKGIKVL